MSVLIRAVLAVAIAAASAPAAAAFELSPNEPYRGDGAGRWVALKDIAGKLFSFDDEAPGDGRSALRLDRLVVGIDPDVTGALDARWSGRPAAPGALEGAGARIGYAFGRFIVYGAAGGAFASADFARDMQAGGPTRIGWKVGGGVETALFGGVNAKLEYLYVDIDRRSLDADGDVSFARGGGQFRAALNYRF